jgi:hypothetical protein
MKLRAALALASRSRDRNAGTRFMFAKLKESWTQLRKGKPGSRFQDQYDRNRREQTGPLGRVVRIVVGLLLFPVGVFFLAVPGPGLLVIAVGAVMIAREFEFAAKVLDRIEVRGRQALGWARRTWRRLTGSRRATSR